MNTDLQNSAPSAGLKWRQRIGYGMLESGRFLADFLIQLYLMIYLTDVVRVPVMAVGTMFLACKLIDAVTDYIAGILVDRTYTRFGKSRPWSALGSVMAFIGLILVFNSPESFSTNGRLVYAYITYSFYSLGLTFLNIPEFTIMPALSNDPQERTVLATCRQLFGNVINFGGTYVCAGLLAMFAGSKGQGYPKVAVVIAFAVLIFEFIGIGMVKEIYVEKPAPKSDKTAEKKDNPIKTSVKVFKNPKFWLFGFMAAFISFGFVMTLTSGVYFFKYAMENPMLQGTCMASLSIAQFIGMFLCPAINGKFEKRTMVIGGLIMAEVGYALLFLGGTSQTMAIVAYFIFGLGFAIAFTMYFALMPELFDYLEYEIGYSVSGIASSLTQYLVKVGNALCATAVAAVLSVGKYEAAIEVQSDYTKTVIRAGISIVPGVICLLGILCVWFLNLEKMNPTVRAELARRRGEKPAETAEEAATEVKE